MAGRETNKSYYKKFRDLDRDSIVLSHIDNEELANRVKSDFRYEAIKNKIEEGRPKLSEEATRQQELRQAIDDYNAKNKNKPTQYIGMPSDNVSYDIPELDKMKYEIKRTGNRIVPVAKTAGKLAIKTANRASEFVSKVRRESLKPPQARILDFALEKHVDKFIADHTPEDAIATPISENEDSITGQLMGIASKKLKNASSFQERLPFAPDSVTKLMDFGKDMAVYNYNKANRVGDRSEYENAFEADTDRDKYVERAVLDPKSPINDTNNTVDAFMKTIKAKDKDIYDFYDSNMLYELGITDKSYDLLTMNDKERAVYNYHYAKNGKKEADKYRKSISNELRHRASLKIQEKNASKSAIERGADGLLTAFETGLDRGTTNLVVGVPKAMFGIDTKSEPSIEEHNFARIRENSQGAYKTALDVTNSVGNAIPSIAVDAAGTPVGMPWLGSVASGVGGAYQGAIDEGYSVDQARVYGAIQGVSPLVVNKFVGELGKIGGSTAEKFLNNKEAFSEAVKGITSAIESPVGKKLLKDAIEEAGSESEAVISGYLGYYINNALRNIIFEEDNDLNPISEEAWNDAIIGAMSEGVLKAPGAFVDAARTYNAGKNSNIEDYSGIAQRLDINENNYTDDGLFNVVKDTKDIAEFLSNKKSNGKKIGNFEKGMLENNLNTILTESEQYYRPYTETEVIPSEENLNGNSENIILPTPIDRRAKQFPANGENAYNAAYRDNLPIDIYDEGFKAAYNAGRFNQPLDEITHPSYHMLSDDQKNLAYEAGKADSRAIRENRNRNR